MFDGLRLALLRRLATLTGQDTDIPPPATDPSRSEDLRKQGNALIAKEEYDLAEKCFREALAYQPDDTKLLMCLGYALKEQARFSEARVALRRITTLGATDSEASEAHYLLAEISEIQADPEDAMRHLRRALDLKPDFARACGDMVRLLEQNKQGPLAKELLVKSVDLCPDCLEYRLWLARVLADEHDLEAAVKQLTAIVALGGGVPRVYVSLGAALCRLGRYDEALPYFEKAQTVDSTVTFETHYHKGYFQTRAGNFEEAIALYEQSIQLKPDYLPSHQMLLYTLCLLPSQAPGRYKEAALRFNQSVTGHKIYPKADSQLSFTESKRPLRIGLCAGEFKHHPVYFFLVGVLTHIDRSKFEIIAYSYNRGDDAKTLVLKEKMDEWHDVQVKSDDEVAQLIHSHAIDVLIDLGGHTGDGRLPVFARHPAAVQATWLGYFASTGLHGMDYIIADPISIPDESSEWFSEEIIRLPNTRLCMEIPKPTREIPISPPPSVARGYVTFGSFPQAVKLNQNVLKAWSTILTRVPNSRLRIQSLTFDTVTVRQQIATRMSEVGIDLARVDIIGKQDWEEYLEAHGEVDLIIDTFPYTGGTTTATALWMGVPTVTILGSTMLARQGAVMLNCVNLSDWIASDETDYIHKAVKFSGDLQHLTQLRASLRTTAEASPLFDTKRFAKNFEVALTDMHTRYLGRQPIHD